MLVVVDSLHVGVPPHLASAKCATAVGFQLDAEDVVLGQLVAAAAAALDGHLAEVFFEDEALDALVGLECDFYDFGFAVGVGREPCHAGLRRAHRQVVFAVAGDGRHVEALYVGDARCPVFVACVVDGARVVLLEYGDVDYLYFAFLASGFFGLAHKDFLGHLYDFVCAVFVEDDDVVDVGAVADEFVLLQACADEAVGPVDV